MKRLSTTLFYLLLASCFGWFGCSGTEAKCGDADACDDGQTCVEATCVPACDGAADCESGVCREGGCQQATCSDGTKNQGETAEDCGGPNCAPCEGTSSCAAGSDCTSGVCSGGTCQTPACDDGIRNGDEVGVDCGGGCDACPAEAVELTQTTQAFDMPDFLAPSRRFTLRVSGLCGQNCNNGPRHMYSTAFEDTLLVSWMSFYGTQEEAAEVTYETPPSNEELNWSNYRQYGNVSTYRVSDTGEFSLQDTTSFHGTCESVHGMTTSPDGSLIAVLCRGYPRSDLQKSPTLPGAIDLLGELREDGCTKEPEDECYPAFTYADRGAPMYIFEYTDGTVDADPDNIILINRVAGGWAYGHDEISLNNSGDTYFVHLKVQNNKLEHENAGYMAIKRPDADNPDFRFTSSWGSKRAGCGGGHPMANRMAYNSHLDAWSQMCWLDLCPHYCEQPNGRCSSISWQTIPGFDSTPESFSKQTETMLELEHPWSNWFTTSGGMFGILSLGQRGWIGLATGPGDGFDGEAVDNSAATDTVGLIRMPLDVPTLRERGTAATGTSCSDGSTHEYNTYRWQWLDLPGPETARVGLANIAYFGEASEDADQLLLGWSPSMQRKGITNQYIVSLIDTQGNFIGEPHVLENAGWGEDNRWTTMPNSGCVVFPFAWKEGADGPGGYPVETDLDGPVTKTMRMTSICPGR